MSTTSASADELVLPIPITLNTEGVYRVSGTRVTLDTIVSAFRTGATAEEIAQRYPVIPLEDVYAVIAWYLQHQQTADEYLANRRTFAEEVRAENERRFNSTGVRARLLAQKRDSLEAPEGGNTIDGAAQ